MRTPILILMCLSFLAPCTAGAACGPNIPGNLTGDCRVNFQDFAILASDWRIHPNDCPPNFPPGDLNLDCSVDSLDLDQMALHWLQSCTARIPTDLSGDCKVDFNDFTALATDWLQSSDAQAVTEWVAIYEGATHQGRDFPHSIAVDSNDNIYVTGESSGWLTYRDYATIKYSSDSNQPTWVARYNGPGNYYDCAYAIVVDGNDNIYVTGSSDGSGTFSDYATIKYSPDSNEAVWVARYNGPGNDFDGARAIAVDSNDNIYVTGHSWGSGTEYDYATIKYSPDSNHPVWIARYNGPVDGNDYAEAVAVDSNDNIYVTGYCESSGGNYDYATIKYSPDSNQAVWIARYDGTNNRQDQARAIAIDSNDNIYVTGASSGSKTGEDYTTIKYSADSNVPIWVARYHAGNEDYAKAIAVDSNDNIYVTGNNLDDHITIKYSPDSNQPVWVARYNCGSSIIEAIAVDSNDNIYVTGYCGSSGGGYFFATIKYSPVSNQPVWVDRWNHKARAIDGAIAVDSNNNIYVIGSDIRHELYDYITIKYSAGHTCNPQITGDFDLDCDVDIYDLQVFCESWLECNLDPPQNCWQ